MENNKNNLLKKIKSSLILILNSEKIQLWNEPYSKEDGSKLESPTELIKRYSLKLKVDEPLVEEALEELRQHSVEKLQAKKKYQESGVATIFVRLACLEQSTENKESVQSSEFSIEIKLHYSLGSDLKEEISKRCGLKSGQLKLVADGKQINEEILLDQQNIKNLSSVLVLCLSAEEQRAMKESEDEERLARAKKAAQLLVTNEFDDYQLLLEDQDGKPVHLPLEERKALTVAMTLHEKGKNNMKKNKVTLALVFFLEADSEFKKCTSQLLKIVDNYGLLCLDIVWCYFLIQQVSALSDAEIRLKTCEETLMRTYGSNMERVEKVRGSSNQEQAVILRLRIMQGVLAFYKGEFNKAKDIFNQAENELKRLKVDEKDMMNMMEMGYGEKESRLALRFHPNNIPSAIEYILSKRQEKKDKKKKDKTDALLKYFAKILGKTDDEQEVDYKLYKNLTSMGFNEGASLEALRRNNNNFEKSLQFLSENPGLILPNPEKKNSSQNTSTTFSSPTANLATTSSILSNNNITEEMIKHLTSLGFDENVSRTTLHHFNADLFSAANYLIENKGQVLDQWMQDFQQIIDSSSSSTSSRETEKEKLNKQLVEEEIVEDLDGNAEDDYLDIPLDEETLILEEFKARLASL